MAHAPASRQNVMRGGLPAIKNAANPAPTTSTEEQKRAHDESEAEVQADIERMREADKLGEVMDYASHVCNMTPTQIWGVKAVEEKQFTFTRWYFMVKDNAIVDLFMTQEKYDDADVETRRALAHKYGVRYAALGPNHSRRPIEDKDKARQKALREKWPSLVEQLAQKVG